jgi:hypothetical protein
VPLHTEVREQSRTSAALWCAAALVLAAGAMHFVVAPEHFGEAWQFGWFMVIVGFLQVLNAALLAIVPGRPVLLATVAGNLAVVAIFAWAYSVGLPLGPDPGQPETLTPLGLACTLAEAAAALAAVELLLRSSAQGEREVMRAGRASG